MRYRDSYFFAYECLTVPTSFIKKTFLALLNCLCTFVRKSVAIFMWVCFQTLVIYYWLMWKCDCDKDLTVLVWSHLRYDTETQNLLREYTLSAGNQPLSARLGSQRTITPSCLYFWERFQVQRISLPSREYLSGGLITFLPSVSCWT